MTAESGIGIFDSGVGGLTVLHALLALVHELVRLHGAGDDRARTHHRVRADFDPTANGSGHAEAGCLDCYSDLSLRAEGRRSYALREY